MSGIHIVREHSLGLAAARKIAFEWAEQAEQKFAMECTYAQGAQEDELAFTRTGVDGTLLVRKDRFELNAKLGFLLGAFKEKIEGEIVKNLDALLAPAARSKAAMSKNPPASKKTSR